LSCRCPAQSVCRSGPVRQPDLRLRRYRGARHLLAADRTLAAVRSLATRRGSRSGAPMAEINSTGNLSTGTESTPSSEHGGRFPPFQKDTFGSQLLWLAVFFVALYFIASPPAPPPATAVNAAPR